MKIGVAASNAAILEELGRRVRALRLEADLSQAALAQRAGVSLRTVARLEHGGDTQLSALLKCLRALNALDALEAALPMPEPRPSSFLEGAAPRKRASRVARGTGFGAAASAPDGAGAADGSGRGGGLGCGASAPDGAGFGDSDSGRGGALGIPGASGNSGGADSSAPAPPRSARSRERASQAPAPVPAPARDAVWKWGDEL